MATWDRFDICEAYCVIEWDYNLGGWLRERPTNYRRRRSTAVQLFRMKFKPRPNLSYETLTDNKGPVYWAENLRSFLKPGSIEMHDAVYYGVYINAADCE